MDKMKIEELPLDKIVRNAWNPNAMPEAAFERLVKEIDEVGFLEPVQVVPLDDGNYRLLGGEHRVEACRKLGIELVPAVVLDGAKWQDEDLQKFVTVRLNVLKGKLDAGRMASLYEEMAKKYGEEALQELFAYTDKTAWNQTLSQIKNGLKKAGLSKKLVKEFDDASKEIRSVDDLSNILNQLMTKHGDTVQQSYMIFTYGGKDHVYIALDKNSTKALKKATRWANENEKDLNEVILAALQHVVADLKTTGKTPRAKGVLAEEDTAF